MSLSFVVSAKKTEVVTVVINITQTNFITTPARNVDIVFSGVIIRVCHKRHGKYAAINAHSPQLQKSNTVFHRQATIFPVAQMSGRMSQSLHSDKSAPMVQPKAAGKPHISPNKGGSALAHPTNESLGITKISSASKSVT